MAIELNVNGAVHRVEVPSMKPLVEVLRDDLALKGTKVGCSEGRCGACTVLIDGEPIVACLYPVALAHGRQVRTVEGLAGRDGDLSPLQDALLEQGGLQCGICTPGILMSLTAAFEQGGPIDERAVREALAGNLCRCTGYQKIVDAALSLTAVRSQ